MKMRNQLLSLLLTAVMLLGMLPGAAFATEEVPSTSEPGVVENVDVPQPPAGDENADNENADNENADNENADNENADNENADNENGDTALPQPPAGDEDEDMSTVNLFRGDVRANPANIAVELNSAQWETMSSTIHFPAATVTGDDVYSMTLTVDKGTVTTTDATMTELGGKSATWVYATPKTAAEATAALRAVTFDYAEGMVVTVTLDGNTSSGNFTNNTLTSDSGHYYMYVPGELAWSAAYNAAKGYTYRGMKGYLATVTTSTEAAVLSKISTNGAWTGGTSLLLASGNAKINDADSITRAAAHWCIAPTMLPPTTIGPADPKKATICQQPLGNWGSPTAAT